MNFRKDFKEIPIIDIQKLVDPKATSAEIKIVATLIGQACENIGFFYIKNHGVSNENRDELFDMTRRFFDLSLEEKMKLHIAKSRQFRGFVPIGGEITAKRKDWHECIDIQPLEGERDPTKHPLDDPEQWPDETLIPNFRSVIMRTWDQLIYISAKITEAMAISLGMDANYFDPFTGPDICDLRLAHYPPFDETQNPDDFGDGMGAHRDNGFLTILFQDHVGGLEIRNSNDEWIPAPYIKGTCIINIGFMMQRWTNDRYKATWHRVKMPAVQSESRYSVPFFYEPLYDTIVEPLPVCVDENNPPQYEPLKFGDYVSGAYQTAYKSKQDD